MIIGPTALICAFGLSDDLWICFLWQMVQYPQVKIIATLLINWTIIVVWSTQLESDLGDDTGEILSSLLGFLVTVMKEFKNRLKWKL